VFEFRLRILDVREREGDPPSFLGIVEGFPQAMSHAASAAEAERDLLGIALGPTLPGFRTARRRGSIGMTFR
jgi:hypothetical protein